MNESDRLLTTEKRGSEVSTYHPIWTAEDAAALAALAAEFPRTVAESPVLDDLMTSEGLS